MWMGRRSVDQRIGSFTLEQMSRVGLVLGGGGITGASYQLAALMAIELATGWHADDAEVIIGTSAGATVAATVRSGRLDLDALVKPGESRAEVAERINRAIFRRGGERSVGGWLRHGVARSVLNPGLTFALGTPAPYDPGAIGNWITDQIGAEAALGWPEKPTAIVAYDIAARSRTVFGTVGAPDATLTEAVSASSAIPLVFNPYVIDGRRYVDGGVVSGTHADLVLGSEPPLDFVLIIPPMAEAERRPGAKLYEGVFDRVGLKALGDEISIIRRAWPEIEILILRPPRGALAAMRPNPMNAAAAVPTFVRTLTGLRHRLASPDVWPMLERHLGDEAHIRV
jgi:NTE family protein